MSVLLERLMHAVSHKLTTNGAPNSNVAKQVSEYTDARGRLKPIAVFDVGGRSAVVTAEGAIEI